MATIQAKKTVYTGQKTSKEEREARIAAEMENLQAGLEGIKDQDKLYKASLDVYGFMTERRHNYSLNNTFTAMVMGWAAGISVSFLGSYDFWKNVSTEANKVLGNNKWKWYGVKKGQKAFPCLYPKFIWKKDEQNPDKKEKILVGFGIGRTFDIAQTNLDQDILERLYPKPMTGDNFDEQYNVLIEVVESMGYEVQLLDLTGRGYHGCIYPKTKVIEINTKLDKDMQLKVLFHELAHGELGHGIGGDHGVDDRDRGAAEVQAESVAYILANMLGLDTSEYSFKYILKWGRNDLDFIKKCTGAAQKVVGRVVKALEDREFFQLEAAA